MLVLRMRLQVLEINHLRHLWLWLSLRDRRHQEVVIADLANWLLWHLWQLRDLRSLLFTFDALVVLLHFFVNLLVLHL